VAGRCGDAYGPAVACASGVSSVADTALLFCQDTGGQIRFLGIGAEDDMTAEVFLPGSMRFYDIPTTCTTTVRSITPSTPTSCGNYHYHAPTSPASSRTNSPLISIPFPMDQAKQAGSRGCSCRDRSPGLPRHLRRRVLQPGHSGGIVGSRPSRHDELNFFLCNTFVPRGPNGPGMGGVVYGSLALQPFIHRGTSGLRSPADSLALPSGATSLFTGPAFAIANLGGMPATPTSSSTVVAFRSPST